ncbi:MAG TPA: glycosyltransferase family 4 protein [Pirellulales bacterium]
MSRPRLAFISRRFWPLIGGAESNIAQLAAACLSRGCEATLLTARWEPSWPEELNYNGLKVVRIHQPRQRFWGTWRYMQGLRSWLRKHRDAYDLICVSMLKHDAYVAVGVGKTLRVPVVLRAEGAGENGDVAFQRTARFGNQMRSRCQQADAIVAPTRDIEGELRDAGYASGKIARIANGAPVPEVVDPRAKHDCRQNLVSAEPSLYVPYGSPVAVFTGRFHPVKGLRYLISAWRWVVDELSDACLWIVGEGPDHALLQELIVRLNLESRVVLAGPFDSMDDVLGSADLFVLPSLEEGMSLSLLEAMAHQLPVVATDIPGNREVIEHCRHGLLVPAKDPRALAAAILQLLQHRDYAKRIGMAARERVAAEFSMAKTADRHLDLFERLIAEQGRTPA